MSTRFGRIAMMTLAGVMAVAMSVEFVDAKPGRGGSFGSRGARSDSSVPSTPTAPRTAPSSPSAPSAMPNRPGAPAAAPAAKASGMSTMAKGFAAGLIGAGLFGLLSGGSLFGGLNGLMGILGLLLQVALIVLVVRLVIGFFRNRQASSPQASAAGYSRAPDQQSAGPDLSRIGLGGQSATATPAPSMQNHSKPAEPQRSDTVGIGPDDYQAFQGVLTNVMMSYSNEDLAGLRRFATPEVAAGFIRELHENQNRGVVNRLGEPQLLQGDLAEAWYEDSIAYASVAIRYAMTDVTLERATGKTVSGNANQPEETVEIWTFRRDGAGRPWLLAGQQSA